MIIYLVYKYIEVGSLALALSKPSAKSASIYTSKPLLISGIYISPFSRELSRYLLILLIAVSWYALGVLENLAT